MRLKQKIIKKTTKGPLSSHINYINNKIISPKANFYIEDLLYIKECYTINILKKNEIFHIHIIF